MSKKTLKNISSSKLREKDQFQKGLAHNWSVAY